MRHRLIHDYGDVDFDIVWIVVQTRLDPLIAALETLIPEKDAEGA